MRQSDVKQEDGTCHITEESASDLAQKIWRPDASWKYIHTYQHLSKGCCLNPKAGVLGTPYHPFGTPDSRWSYTWLDVDNIQIHVVDFTSGGGCMFVSNVHPEMWGRCSIWRSYVSKGLVQPSSSWITSIFFRLPTHQIPGGIPWWEDCVFITSKCMVNLSRSSRYHGVYLEDHPS